MWGYDTGTMLYVGIEVMCRMILYIIIAHTSVSKKCNGLKQLQENNRTY